LMAPGSERGISAAPGSLAGTTDYSLAVEPGTQVRLTSPVMAVVGVVLAYLLARSLF
jgi:hypothetical protein